MTAVSENDQITENTENGSAVVDRVEPTTFAEYRRAVWLAARAEWEGVPQRERSATWKSYCTDGLNGFLTRMHLPRLNQDVAFFDAWIGLKRFEENHGQITDADLIADLKSNVRAYLRQDEPSDRETMNRWLQNLWIEELPRPRVSRGYDISADGDLPTGAQVAEVLNEKFPNQNFRVRRY